jgi:hypothetical protein
VEIVDLLLTLKANPSLHLDVYFQQAYELCEKFLSCYRVAVFVCIVRHGASMLSRPSRRHAA